MPQPTDMSLIKAAMDRRGMSGGGGGADPMAAQVTAPTGPTPTGGPNTPTTPPPAAPPAPAPGGGQAMPTRAAAAPMARAAQAAQSPSFDDQTKTIAKALVTKLLQYI
jgi:hypothetical protein